MGIVVFRLRHFLACVKYHRRTGLSLGLADLRPAPGFNRSQQKIYIEQLFSKEEIVQHFRQEG